MRHRPRGFTLVEVLVALGIVAIALATGLKATASLTDNARRQSDVLLGRLCAENALVGLRLSQQMPGIGETVAACPQAGENFDVALTVAATPNPNFRRVDAQVRRGAEPVLRVSTIVGRH